VTPVATIEDTPAASVNWTRTPEQEAMVREHLERVARDYANAQPEFRALLQNPTILATPEIQELLGYLRTTRIYQLGTKTRDLELADQLPHPSGMPKPDATGDRPDLPPRQRQIQGTMLGRLALWAVVSGRRRWDPFTKQLVPQYGIQFGGAPTRR
jgi:hypothetical protein